MSHFERIGLLNVQHYHRQITAAVNPRPWAANHHHQDDNIITWRRSSVRWGEAFLQLQAGQLSHLELTSLNIKRIIIISLYHDNHENEYDDDGDDDVFAIFKIKTGAHQTVGMSWPIRAARSWSAETVLRIRSRDFAATAMLSGLFDSTKLSAPISLKVKVKTLHLHAEVKFVKLNSPCHRLLVRGGGDCRHSVAHCLGKPHLKPNCII